MAHHIVNILILIAILSVSTSRKLVGNAVSLRPMTPQGLELVMPPLSDPAHLTESSSVKKWAVLIAGSNGFENYRHQADVCHAYQVLTKGGLKDENIVVFMYDDIAFNPKNPRPGVIINQPHGPDVYEGVPKDYTGSDVNAENFFNVILGNKTGITGKGSGKVVDSGPNDTIFIYYADHGAAGILGMPDGEIYANDFNIVLKKKYESRSYAKMVIYIEACESGSIFEGLLSPDLNIYATTASNATDSSYASYCDGDYPNEANPPYGDVCLGDMYSVSWIEDSEKHNQRTETLDQQFKLVKRRVAYGNGPYSSQVQQFGDMGMASDSLSAYIGTNPDNDNHPVSASRRLIYSPSRSLMTVSQRDADIFHLNRMILKSPRGSKRRIEAKIELANKMKHRMHVDQTMTQISKLLFGSETAEGMLHAARPAGQPLVDDWDCLKSLVRTYELKCGVLSVYGRKYNRAMSNMCNAGLKVEQFGTACDQVCDHRGKHSIDNNL